MTKITQVLLAIALIFCALGVNAQGSFFKTEKDSTNGLFPKQQEKALKRFQVSGFYRFVGTYLNRNDNYILNQAINDTAKSSTLFIGDDSQLPNFNLNISGRPSSNSSFSFDLFAFQFLDGKIGSTYGNQISQDKRPSLYQPLLTTKIAGNISVLLGINLAGNLNTDFGNFDVKLGGINWTHLSDMTMAAFRGYQRFSLVERNPWDPVGQNVATRYESYFTEGNIVQDTRWGERAFQGLLVSGTNLPGKLSFTGLFGKAEQNGGFLSTPNRSYGGRLSKQWNNNTFVALNSFNGLIDSDSLSTSSVGNNTHTAEFKFPIGPLTLHTEAGLSRYFDPEVNLDWAEVINSKLNFSIPSKKFSGELHFFRVGADALNNSSIFWNTSIMEFNPNEIPAGSVGSTVLLRPFASPIVQLGQPTNNRQGFNFNVELPFEKIHFSAAAGFSSELEARTDKISFSSAINNLTHSRFWRWNFPTEVGPYGRYNVIYRGTFQNLDLVPVNGAPNVSKKHFAGLEFQTKAKLNLGIRPLYIFVLNRFYSAQDFASPFTVFSEEAMLRQYVQEIELYYRIRPKLILTAYGGIENHLGNYQTEVNTDTRRPVNQLGKALVLGFDYEIAKNTAIFFRHRWFDFEDRSFVLDKYNGQESILELKIFF